MNESKAAQEAAQEEVATPKIDWESWAEQQEEAQAILSEGIQAQEA